MRILVDAMGGDLAPDEIVKGAVHAQQELGAEIVLVGQRAAIEACLRNEQAKLEIMRGMLDGLSPKKSLILAAKAAAIAVSRPGAAPSIPLYAEVTSERN